MGRYDYKVGMVLKYKLDGCLYKIIDSKPGKYGTLYLVVLFENNTKVNVQGWFAVGNLADRFVKALHYNQIWNSLNV
jgi:hypothetical protein